MSVYLIHFDEPIGNPDDRTGQAQHYTGSARYVRARLSQHEARPDAKIMIAVRQAGIGWTLARTWEGGRVRERQIKIQGGAARHCPTCKGREPQLDAVGSQPYRAAGRALEPEKAPPAVRWTKPPEPEPEPLEDFLVARLEPAEAAALVRALDDGQRAAWQHTAPGPDYEARFQTACDLARLSGAEGRANQRMAEAREIAAADEAAYREAQAREPPTPPQTGIPPPRQNGAQMTPDDHKWLSMSSADRAAAVQAVAARHGHEMTDHEAREAVQLDNARRIEDQRGRDMALWAAPAPRGPLSLLPDRNGPEAAMAEQLAWQRDRDREAG